MNITEPFLQEYLNTALPGVNHKIFPLAGDASNRRYYRIITGEQTHVLMRWEPFDPANYPFLSVHSHFFKAGVKVPEVIHMAPDKGLVLLEDLGDLTLERRFWESQNQEHALVFYQMAIDELIKIHHHSTALKGDCSAFHVQFDTAKFLWEMNYGKENLFQGILKFEIKTVEKELQDVFISICERLHQEPKKVAHRDYHSRNLMIKLDSVRVIDFQDARLGPIQYDLVSLLKDSYVDLNDNMTSTLIEYYLGRSQEFLPRAFSRESFDLIYELQTVQRCFKACGSFASFFHQRGDRRYLKYITPTLKRVLKSLNHFPEYKIFADVIIDSGSLEKNYLAL
ncbi:MAG: phosphotransferase [Bdellovibrionaceae bacterium]|nr:phosphotransferase [Pseudobdellovibrionaceae bacterium]